MTRLSIAQMSEKRNVKESLQTWRKMFQYRLTFEYHLLSLHASFKNWKGLLLCNTNDSKPLKMGQISFLMTVCNFFVGYEKSIFFSKVVLQIKCFYLSRVNAVLKSFILNSPRVLLLKYEERRLMKEVFWIAEAPRTLDLLFKKV